MGTINYLQAKIKPLKQVLQQINGWRLQNKTVVFTNGCFDILHPGHITYLAEAAALGDYLIIGLNSDASVKRLKGENRPIQNQDARSLLLSALSFVSAIVLFDADTPTDLIAQIKPDILVKGSDYLPDQIAGSASVLDAGGQVKTLTYLPDQSTSILIERIRKQSNEQQS